MLIRERTEEQELQLLAPEAAKARQTLGRERPEPECELRTAFQRDRDRILHCKSFRRLKHKTQVFLSPEGDHYRTRLTHTLEVSQIARTIARCLQLNEDLTEAISLGHDLGHTPFGHAGERALNAIAPGGFRHYEQSVRVVELLENEGRGLNLTAEVRDGIRCHTTGTEAFTAEGRVVRIADRIAYINHDIDDAQRAGVLDPEDIPWDITEALGDRRTTRINTLVTSLVKNSVPSQLAMRVAQEPVSLETPIGEEEDSHLGDFIPDDDAPAPADAASHTLLKEQLTEVLNTLTPREEKVLSLRFGLEDGRSRTLEEVGREFKVTRERIRQIEAKALRKLRHPSRSKKLKDFLD